MSQSYFKQLNDDMFQLGLITYPENSKHYRPSNYEAMHYEFLDKTRYIVPETWNLTRDDPAHRKIQTTLGRRILKLMSAGVEFDELHLLPRSRVASTRKHKYKIYL